MRAARPADGGEARLDLGQEARDDVVLRALGRYGSPFGLPSLDQADDHDDRWEPLGGGRIGRFFEGQLHGRDSQLVRALGVIHAERQHEPVKIAVVFGAAHIPAVVDYLTGQFAYYVGDAAWLTVAHAPPPSPGVSSGRAYHGKFRCIRRAIRRSDSARAPSRTGAG